MKRARTGRRRLTAGALAACAAPAGAGAQAAAAPFVGLAAPYAAVAQALESLVEHERAQKGIPAISVALVDGRRVVWARGFGWADSAAGVRATAATVYRVGAVPGPFADAAARESTGRAAGGAALAPGLRAPLARGTLWTLDGRRIDAPAAPLGAGPGTDRYGTVLDFGRLVAMVSGGRATPDGPRAVAGDGVAAGFATALRALPDDSLGVAVVATLDGATAVTAHIAAVALRLMRDARAGRAPTPDALARDTTAALPSGRALALMGRYAGARSAVDLQEYEGRLYLTPVRGGARAELRAPADAPDQLVVDDPLAYGPRVTVLGGDRLVFGGDTLRREPTPGAAAVAMAEPKPAPAAAEYAPLIGEYGSDDNTLYVREKDGRLGVVIDRLFEYPLTRVSPNVYRFPPAGRYAGRTVVFRRGADGRAAVAVAGTAAGGVPLARRALPGDDDRVNARTPPVRPPDELRREALAATPPVETGEFRRSDLVELRGLDPTIRYDIRYATSNNFMGTPFYSSAHAFMQRPAAEAVARASAALRPLGYGLLVHDSYRPWYVTKMFWDGTPPDKHVFVANPAEGSRHNRGAAVDLTLCDLRTGAPIRMTGGYDETTTRSYPLYPGGTSLQRWHRDLLRHAMEAQGFTVYEAEWWHFDYKDWRRYPIGTLTFEQLAARGATP